MSSAVPVARRTSVRRGVRDTAVALVLGLALAGCGDGAGTAPAGDAASPSPSPSPSTSSSPSASASEKTPSASPAAVTLAVQVRGDEVTPLAEQVDLPVGETLVVTVDADRAGELHVHADPEQHLAFDSGTAEFEVTLETPGSVDIEEHEADALVARVLVR